MQINAYAHLTISLGINGHGVAPMPTVSISNPNWQLRPLVQYADQHTVVWDSPSFLYNGVYLINLIGKNYLYRMHFELNTQNSKRVMVANNGLLQKVMAKMTHYIQLSN